MFLKLSGAALIDGDQELVVAATMSDETGSSVTGEFSVVPALWQTCNIGVKPGNVLNLFGSYNGTDSGTEAIVVSLEFS